MHSFIQISKINDFLFNPDSIYFHAVYESFDKSLYQSSDQIEGSLSHERIDTGKYSSRKTVLKGTPVFSMEYGIVGKLDIFDIKNCVLVERKNKIKKIHDGYILQLYAQYYCLVEKGYEIKEIKLHSIKDNKSYKVELPTKSDSGKLKDVLQKMRNYVVNADYVYISEDKAKRCIYNSLFF